MNDQRKTNQNTITTTTTSRQQEPPKSGKFAFNYNGDYATERVLVACGAATLHPDDGGAVGSRPLTFVRCLLGST